MPNRILRDWTDSFDVDSLDANSERFLVRLIMVADDYGRYHADPRMLRAKCFPLKTEIRDADITRWLAVCEKAGIVRSYGDGKGRMLLEIKNFNQRSRSPSKFPSPDDHAHGTCQTNDGQMTVKCPTNDSLDVVVFVDEVEDVSIASTGTSSRRPQHKIGWDSLNGFHGITEVNISDWSAAYPAVDLNRQMAAAHAWLQANPAKARKSNWQKFLTNWFTRAQDRGGDMFSNRPQQNRRRELTSDDVGI